MFFSPEISLTNLMRFESSIGAEYDLFLSSYFFAEIYHGTREAGVKISIIYSTCTIHYITFIRHAFSIILRCGNLQMERDVF
jgi:hypothetical protein